MENQNQNTNTKKTFNLRNFITTGRDKLKDKFKNIFNKDASAKDANNQEGATNPQTNQGIKKQKQIKQN